MLHHKRVWFIVVLICALLGSSALAGELSGGFDDSSISLAQGESARVSGWVETSGAGLTRVTLTIDGYHTGDDGNDRYASREFGGETSISLQDYGEFTLDSSSAPLNEPGSYTVHLWAADEEGSKELAKMKVTVEAPPAEEEPEFEEETWEDDAGEDYVEEYSEEESYEDAPADEPHEEEYVEEEEPEPLPVEINGGFDSGSAEVTLGDLATVDGWVEVSNGTLSRVTLTVSGYQTGDGNDRYATREFGGESSIELGNYAEFTLDTTREPLNQPGSYTVNLWAAASDGSSTELGSMTVDVIAPPEPEPEPEPEPGSEPEHEPDPNAVILEEGVALSGGFDEDSVELRVGESRRVAGEVSAQGDSLAQVTYQIDGWSGDDENNRYCTQEVSDASSVKLENMAGLVLDASAAPLNEPGEYTLHLVARVAGGEYAELDAMTVSVLPQDIASSPSHSPEEGGATVRATGDAYVRTAPDKDSPNLGTVGAGTELPYLGESQTDGRGVTWYKVSFGGAEAWISSNVSQRSIDQSKHSPEETPKPAPTSNDEPFAGTVYITGDINARLAPDPNGDILCTIASGTTLEYLGETSTDYRGIDWYRASYNGNSVWLSSKYAELRAGQSEAPAPTPEPDIGPVEITGGFDLDSLEMRVGERQVLSGSVSAERDVLVQVTYQIDGWYGDDENNRYCTQAVDGLQSVQLAELEGLCLDGTTEPLNQPGEYTLWLVARTSDGTYDRLDSMAVTVLPACDHTEIREPLHTVRVDKNDDNTHMAVVLYRVHCQCGQVDYTEEVTEAQPHDLSYRGVEAKHTAAGHNVFVRCNACGYARLTGEHQAFLESCNTCLSEQIASEGGAIRNGARGNIVTQIQDKLVQLGFLSGGVDGIFGKNTQAAVEAFQTARGLSVTGTVDSATWEELMAEKEAAGADQIQQPAEASECPLYATGHKMVLKYIDKHPHVYAECDCGARQAVSVESPDCCECGNHEWDSPYLVGTTCYEKCVRCGESRTTTIPGKVEHATFINDKINDRRQTEYLDSEGNAVTTSTWRAVGCSATQKLTEGGYVFTNTALNTFSDPSGSVVEAVSKDSWEEQMVGLWEDVLNDMLTDGETSGGSTSAWEPGEKAKEVVQTGMDTGNLFGDFDADIDKVVAKFANEGSVSDSDGSKLGGTVKDIADSIKDENWDWTDNAKWESTTEVAFIVLDAYFAGTEAANKVKEDQATMMALLQDAEDNLESLQNIVDCAGDAQLKQAAKNRIAAIQKARDDTWKKYWDAISSCVFVSDAEAAGITGATVKVAQDVGNHYLNAVSPLIAGASAVASLGKLTLNWSASYESAQNLMTLTTMDSRLDVERALAKCETIEETNDIVQLWYALQINGCEAAEKFAKDYENGTGLNVRQLSLKNIQSLDALEDSLENSRTAYEARAKMFDQYCDRSKAASGGH